MYASARAVDDLGDQDGISALKAHRHQAAIADGFDLQAAKEGSDDLGLLHAG